MSTQNALPREIVTIDGDSASGKSTLARKLAEKLGFVHFNSGEIYRAFAYGFSKKNQNVDPKSVKNELVLQYLQDCLIILRESGDLEVDGERLSSDQRQELSLARFSELTSILSAVPEVRAKLYLVQKNAYYPKPIVAEGRDQGSNVFKAEAIAKFYIIATPEVRAARRLRQQPEMRIEDIQREIIERDERDRSRAVNPSKPAPDAIVIENDSDTISLAIERMEKIVRERMRK